MSAGNRSLSSSYESSDSENRWGEGQRGRLTAAQELRGHFDDCVSLYKSRFLHIDFSQTFIRQLNQPTAHLPSADIKHASLQPAGKVSDSSSDSSTAPEEREENDFGHALDTSTVATVLVLRDGARATTPGSPLGVVVSFHYYRGFIPLAECRFHAEKAAAENIEKLRQGTWTVEELSAGQHGWTALPDEAGAASGGVDDVVAKEALAAKGDGSEGSARAYESLMSLLVHRYL